MRSIAARLTAAYTLSLLAITALMSFAGSQLIETRMMQASDALVDSEFGRIRNHLLQGPPTTDPGVLEKRLRKLTDNTANLLYVDIRHRDGRSLFRSRNLGGERLPIRATPRYRADIRAAGDVEMSRYDIPPYYHVLIATSRHPVLLAMRSYMKMFLKLFALVLLIGAATGYFLSQLSLRPLRSIRDTCTRISLETLDARIPVSAVNDELSSLSRLLNEMLDRLDASIRQMRRFSSDASHELKTPLTLMRLHVDRLLADQNLSGDQRATVEELVGDLTHLQQTISGLLLLSRLDSKSLPVDMVLQSPNKFLQDQHNDLAALCEHDNCRFVWLQHGSGEAVFDARWLRQVMLNLVTNAIRASSPGGVIAVDSTLSGDEWTVTVHDQGTGLAASQHERIFERFVRVGDEDGGCGLGLAICRSIIQLHGGTIRAAHGLNNIGLQVSFTLPGGKAPRLLASGPSVESVTTVRRRPAAAVPAALVAAIAATLFAGPGAGVARAAPASDAVVVASSPRTAALAERLAAIVAAADPTVATTMMRTTAGGVAALTAGAADIAIVERTAWELERRPFRQTFGHEPVGYSIGTAGPAAGTGQRPPSVYVSTHNPLPRIAFRTVARMLATGLPEGDVETWGQAGATGAFAARRVHVYGAPDDGGYATNLRLREMPGTQFAPAYEPLDRVEDVLAALAGDDAGIAVIDAAPARLPAGVRPLALDPAGAAGGPSDPLADRLMLYVTTPKDGAMPHAVRAFVDAALSPAGQRAVASIGDLYPLPRPAAARAGGSRR